MAKRRISKASKKRLLVFGSFCVFFIIYSIISLVINIYQIYDLTKQKNNLERLYVELQEKSENLKNDIEKLNDETYLANYAREHYLYSKDGEYIIQIEEDNKELNLLEKELNKKYIIISLSAVMFLMFIYIFIKGHKNKKRKK